MNELDIMVAQERQQDLQREVEQWRSIKASGFTPRQSWWQRLFSLIMRDNQKQPTYNLRHSSNSHRSLFND